jgi:hypothetical protein
VASPSLLGLADHPCAYCLLASTPVGPLGIVLFLTGAFGAAWAALALLATRDADAAPERLAAGSALGRAALFGWLGVIVLASSQWALA